jgi:multidrug resistance efflux pump
MKKGLTVVLLLGIIVLAFASFIPLFETAEQQQPVETVIAPAAAPVVTGIIAEAKLWPKTDAALGFRSSGVLTDLSVAAGDDVKQGDVLAVLQGAGQYQLAYSQASLDLIEAEKDLKSLNDTHKKMAADADLAIITAKIALDDAEKAFEEFETPVYRKKIDDANELARNKKKDLDDAQELVDDVADLASDSARRITVEDDYVKVRQAYDDLVRKYNVLVNDKDRAAADIANAEAVLEDAEREKEDLKDGPKQADLDVINQRITAAKDAQTSAEENIELMKIIAPFDGKVVSVDAVAGEMVSASQTIMILVDPSEMILKTVDLSETSMNSVHVGDTVTAVFDAYPGSTIRGTVTKITNWAGVYLGDVVFPVEITLETTKLPLLWGMTASVTFD